MPDRPGREIPRTLTASEAAALIGVSVATVRGWADSGVLPSHRTIGGHRRFELGELRDWLAARGAPVAERLRPRTPAGEPLPPAPRLARALNARTERIVARVEAGYAEDVPAPVPRSTDAALRRAAVRFLRVATAALESGRLATSMGRAELAGYRAGLQGAAGLGVALELTRVMVAMAAEAEQAAAEGAADGAHALPALLAVGDAMQAAVLTGVLAAREESAGGAPLLPGDVGEPWEG